MNSDPAPMQSKTLPGRVRDALRRFFREQEPGFTVRYVAYLLAVGLIQLVLWAAFLVGLYLAWQLWIQVVQISYSSPKNYLLYSLLPLLGLSFIFGVGQVLRETWGGRVSGWWRRRKARRKRRASRRRDGPGTGPRG